MNPLDATWPGRILTGAAPARRRRSSGSRRTAQAAETVSALDGDEAFERRLYAIARQVRAYLEPVWLEWHTNRGGDIPAPLSRSTCGRTSLFLKHVLRSECPGGPQPTALFGFHAGGDWQSHAWVESGGHIIDLTADQFGDTPVIVTPSPDPRYQKGVTDTAFPEFVRAHQRAVDRLWLRWLQFRGSDTAT